MNAKRTRKIRREQFDLPEGTTPSLIRKARRQFSRQGLLSSQNPKHSEIKHKKRKLIIKTWYEKTRFVVNDFKNGAFGSKINQILKERKVTRVLILQ